mmetsp:Transcript_4917/g.2735  ORF Transcript_4917/g.2735 Transcript_4917/m.2735 type:complete len:327 (+) Transcript_4917:4935-5915(+)
MKDIKQQILALVEDDLKTIEEELEKNLSPHFELVSTVAKHILFSGGKRIRPLLMIICARLCEYKGDYEKTFSVVFEYIHTATLLHDDLIDEASIRRGKRVAHKIWNAPTVILTGDFLLAKALSITAKSYNPKAILVIAKLAEEMVEGELEQLAKKRDLSLSEEDYKEIIRCKTAALFEGACKIGAIISNANERIELALSKYGYNLGMAFQMVDDLLDYTAEASVLGKKIGIDLKEGNLTLPVIYAFNKAQVEDKKIMESIIANPNSDKKELKILIGLLKKYKSIDYVKKAAATYIMRAKESLEIFEDSKAKKLLLLIADYTLARNL